MRVREWTGADYYAELGVSTTATRDEITAAYRARARVLHPDTGPTDPQAEAHFVRASTAYRVLTGPLREEYDRARRRGAVRPFDARPVTPFGAAPGAAPAPAASKPWHLSRRGARSALWGGVGLILAGVVAAVVVVALQVRDANLRSHGVPVTANVVPTNTGIALQFPTRSGRLVETGVPDLKSGRVRAGETVPIRYDRDHPTRVVTEHNNVTRDITLWIIAAKFLIVGAVLTIVGARRVVRSDPRSA
jgi:hypothetical protein